MFNKWRALDRQRGTEFHHRLLHVHPRVWVAAFLVFCVAIVYFNKPAQSAENNTLQGLQIQQAWEKLRNAAPDDVARVMREDVSALDDAGAQLRTAAGNVLAWAQGLDTGLVPTETPFGQLRRYADGAKLCVVAKPWLVANQTYTLRLWNYLEQKRLLTDNIRVTAMSVVAMLEGPLVRSPQQLEPYMKLEPFPSYLANPDKMGSCLLLNKPSAMFGMLIHQEIPNKARREVREILTREALRLDGEAIILLAWLTNTYFQFSGQEL